MSHLSHKEAMMTQHHKRQVHTIHHPNMQAIRVKTGIDYAIKAKVTYLLFENKDKNEKQKVVRLLSTLCAEKRIEWVE